MITVNGESLSLCSGETLAQFLLRRGYEKSRVAVERNGQIVPKAQFDALILEEGDTLEVVCFVGGG
jgi:sulfur carrier protein